MGRVRLQVLITLIAVALLAAVMTYLAYEVTTVTVPDYGGTYVEGLVGNPQYLNPILCHANPVDQDICALLFAGLSRANAKGEIVPDLAESWDVSSNGIEYTFHLRKDVTWHDGAPLTANDVLFTVSAVQHPDFQGAPYISEMWRTVVVELVDNYTVRCILREPFAPFLDYTTMGILPVHVLGSTPAAAMAESQFNAEPIGCGPLMVDQVSAQRLLLVANPAHYGSRPYLDRVDLRFFPNDDAVMAARQRGELDGIGHVPPHLVKSVGQDAELALYSAPLSGHNLIYLNLDRGIFQDRAVRQAMLWALERERLVDEIVGGQAIVIHSPIVPQSWAYAQDVHKYRHDARRAIALLEDAGWYDDNGDGVRERGPLKLEFSLSTNSDDAIRVQLVQAISAQLASVGIRAVPQTVSWEELVGDMLRLRRYDAILSGWQSLPPDPDPYPYWHSSQVNENGLNFANWMNETADRLLEDGRSTSAHEQRIEIYQRFQELFANEVPSIPLYQPVHNFAVDVAVQGIQIGPMYDRGDRFRTFADWYIATERIMVNQAQDRQRPLPR